MEFDTLSNRVIGCAIEVHRELGPGLLESTYEQRLLQNLPIIRSGRSPTLQKSENTLVLSSGGTTSVSSAGGFARASAVPGIRASHYNPS